MPILKATPWYKEISSEQWKTLFAAQLGWMLDAMDVMLYAFALTTLQKVFQMGSDKAGLVASLTLLASAFGGIGFGVVADKIGRKRALIITILIYSLCSAATATSGTFLELMLWRMLLGIGLGGEWSSGAVLVSETWPAEHRGKAIGIMQSGWALGYIAAALLSAFILPTYGWRILFLVGVFPAFLTVWIRRAVGESPIWLDSASKGSNSNLVEIFRGKLARKTLLAALLTASVLFAYWGLFTWLPGFLATPVEKGGAGMSVVKTATWIIPVQLGAFFGYISFGFIADRIGRRPAFIAYLVASAILVPVYGKTGSNQTLLMILGPLVGFFGSGYFSLFGVILSELYPTAVRATGQGFTYNTGRAISALAPYTIGWLAISVGVGSALLITSFFFLTGALLIMLLPETRGEQLK
ncbi:MAG: MFS transporter [Blastocatellia bacterium]|nr:MFS transporter [Blastocatellia bacterium]